MTRPVLRLRPKISPRPIRFGAPWIFADQLVLDRRTKALPAGTIATLEDGERVPLATVAVTPGSKIAARVLDADPAAQIDADWLRVRLSHALALRDRLYDAPFYRLVHAEADGLPGLVIDRFGDTLAMQPNAAWADRLAAQIAEVAADVTGARTVHLNASGRARGLEGLDDHSHTLIGTLDELIEVPMNGARYMADLAGGQKTGLFYDQRDNHGFAAKLARGLDVLDVFSHVGGFALAALAAGARSALAVDGAQPALDLAMAGAEASGVADRFETRKGDALATLRALAGSSYGMVICDPPAFAPSKPALEAGLRGYENIALAAAPLVAPGGYLVLCSCSHAADLAKFRAASLKGIGRAGRRAQILHQGGAGPDHPTHPHLAQTSYLKSLFVRLDG